MKLVSDQIHLLQWTLWFFRKILPILHSYSFASAFRMQLEFCYWKWRSVETTFIHNFAMCICSSKMLVGQTDWDLFECVIVERDEKISVDLERLIRRVRASVYESIRCRFIVVDAIMIIAFGYIDVNSINQVFRVRQLEQNKTKRILDRMFLLPYKMWEATIHGSCQLLACCVCACVF